MPVSTASYTPGDMYLGNYPLMTRGITVASGAGVLKRGTVLGQITASKKYLTSLAAAVDGSETPRLILAEDIDASAADVACKAYWSGDFDDSKLTFGTGITSAAAEAAFDAAGIPLFLKTLK